MVGETIALKATVEPILIRPMMAAMILQKPIERIGSAVRLLTCKTDLEDE